MENEEMIYQHGATPHKEVPNFKPKVQPLIMYKQFKLRLDQNGKNLTPGVVYPLYVNTENGLAGKDSKGLQIGKWYKSGEGECWLDTDNNRLYTKGKGYGTDGNTMSRLAYRPGWHLTTTPWGNQRGAGKVTGGPKGTGNNYANTRNSEVWAKLEICVDIDATEKAMSMSDTPTDQCLQKLGDNEYYRYRTNTNATKDQTWYIVDKIRIIDILDDDTVDNINDAFYKNIAKETNRKINNNPLEYTTDSGDIPYWKMPRENGKRYSKEDIRNMGYNAAEPTKINESKLIKLINKAIKNKLNETFSDLDVKTLPYGSNKMLNYATYHDAKDYEDNSNWNYKKNLKVSKYVKTFELPKSLNPTLIDEFKEEEGLFVRLYSTKCGKIRAEFSIESVLLTLINATKERLEYLYNSLEENGYDAEIVGNNNFIRISNWY